MHSRNLFTDLLVLILVLLLGLTLWAGCTTQPAGQVGGVLRVSSVSDPTMIGNPSTNLNQPQPYWADVCIETLLRTDKTGAPIPWLATGWNMSNDGKTITFNLQKGVKFHDDTDFNAQAVKWNLDKFKGAKRPEMANVQSIDVVDDYTIKVTMAGPDSLFFVNLAHIAGQIISPTSWQNAGSTDKERNDWCEKNPVGTGPFKFTGWQRTIKVTYKKFENYWQKGKPNLDGIEWVVIPDTTVRKAALQAGEIHIMYAAEPQVAKELGGSKDYVIGLPVASSRVYALAGDSVHSDSPYANIKVRQAIQYAVDTKAICNSIGFGYWEPTNQYASVGTWGYNPNVVGYPYNPDKAKQLLQEAGYASGFKTTLTSMAGTANQDLLTAISGYLSKVNIDAKVNMVTSAAQQPMLSSGGWTNGMQFVPLGCEPNELSGLNRYYSYEMHASRISSLALPDEYMDLIRKASSSPNFDTMKNLVQQIQKAGTDKYCIELYICTMKTMSIKSTKVHDDGLSVINGLRWTPETAWLSQ